MPSSLLSHSLIYWILNINPLVLIYFNSISTYTGRLADGLLACEMRYRPYSYCAGRSRYYHRGIWDYISYPSLFQKLPLESRLNGIPYRLPHYSSHFPPKSSVYIPDKSGSPDTATPESKLRAGRIPLIALTCNCPVGELLKSPNLWSEL